MCIIILARQFAPIVENSIVNVAELAECVANFVNLGALL